jgi:hypothetical protein
MRLAPCALVALLLTGCQPTALSGSTSRESERLIDPAPADAPFWQVGDTWVFRWESPQGKGVTVWTVDREETVDGVQCYVVKSGPWNSYWRKSDLAFHLDKHGGVIVTRYDPPQVRYVWPLVAGARWEQRYRRENRRKGETREVTMACEIEADEAITVPAGTFTTRKIVCRNTATETIMHETWYAPEVKTWVRERGRFSFGLQERELIAFERASPHRMALRRGGGRDRPSAAR